MRGLPELGADLAINYRDEDFVAAVKEATGGRGVDVILDMVGGDYIPRNYEAAAQDGRIVQIAFLQGSRIEIDFSRLMLKRLTHTGSTLRARARSPRRPPSPAALEAKVWPLLGQGPVQAGDRLDASPSTRWPRPMRRMDEGAHIGKIVLRL